MPHPSPAPAATFAAYTTTSIAVYTTTSIAASTATSAAASTAASFATSIAAPGRCVLAQPHDECRLLVFASPAGKLREPRQGASQRPVVSMLRQRRIMRHESRGC